MNKVLAVIVTYNRLSMLKSTIEYLTAQKYPCDILIVDNASSDATGEWASKLQSSETQKILYANTGANLGGAGGFNFGLRYAAEAAYEYAWIMDDDAFPKSDCLQKLMESADALCAASDASGPAFGFLSSIVLWKDGSICKMNWQRKLHLPRNRAEHHITDQDLLSGQKQIPIQSATFVSLLFPVSVIRRVGLPIKDFFIWCDDIEYTRRISLKYHLPCYAITDSRIVHQIANNVGTDIATDSVQRIPRYNYAFRNENYMYRQYGLKGFGYYILVCIYNLFKIIKNAPDHKLQRMGVIFKNFFTGLFFNPPIERL